MATTSTTSSPFAIAVLEVAVDDKGAVRVLSVDMAIGCGPISPGGSGHSSKVAPELGTEQRDYVPQGTGSSEQFP